MNSRVRALVVRATLVILLSGLSLFTSACKGTPKPNASPSPSPSASPSPPASDFFVKILPPVGTTMYTHLANTPWINSPCLVTQDSTPQDLRCVIEAPEADLYYRGATLNYQFPSGTRCAYGIRKDFAYYQYYAGQGATQLTMQVGINNVSDAGAHDGIIQAYSDNHIATGLAATSQPLSPGAPPICSTDHSSANAPNCCPGTYTLTTTTYTYVPAPTPSDAPKVISSNTQTSGTWGGATSNCLVGPAMDASDKFLIGNAPKAVVTAIGSQPVNANLTIASPHSKGFYSNAYLANYFTDLSTLPTNSFLENSTNWPAPFYQPFYEFSCADESNEIVHRIRVFIRSWSSISQFTQLSNSAISNAMGSETSPFSGPVCDFPAWFGPAGTSCSFGTSLFPL